MLRPAGDVLVSKRAEPGYGAVQVSQTVRVPGAGLGSPAVSVALSVVVENVPLPVPGPSATAVAPTGVSFTGGSVAGSRNESVKDSGPGSLAPPGCARNVPTCT